MVIKKLERRAVRDRPRPGDRTQTLAESGLIGNDDALNFAEGVNDDTENIYDRESPKVGLCLGGLIPEMKQLTSRVEACVSRRSTSKRTGMAMPCALGAPPHVKAMSCAVSAPPWRCRAPWAPRHTWRHG